MVNGQVDKPVQYMFDNGQCNGSLYIYTSPDQSLGKERKREGIRICGQVICKSVELYARCIDKPLACFCFAAASCKLSSLGWRNGPGCSFPQ